MVIDSWQAFNKASHSEVLQWFREQVVESVLCDAWIESMLAHRPYAEPQHFLTIVEATWRGLSDQERIDMMNGHPEIGKSEATEGSAMEATEQLGMSQASDELTARIDRDKAIYRQRFGFIYMIFATGKTAEELAEALQNRLKNTREEELAIATTEFWRIHEKRLKDKLVL